MIIEVKEIAGTGSGLEIELENYRKRCLDLEERSKKAEERCLVLENEVSKWKSEFMLLNGRFEVLETEKLRVEDEVRVLKNGIDDLNERVSQARMADKFIDLIEDKEDEDAVVQLMIENKVLECEKKKAESEVEVWKGKLKDLEGLISRSGKQPLAGNSEGLTEKPEMCAKEMSEARGLNDGLDMHFQIESKMMGGEKKTHAANRLSTTLESIDQGTENITSSGTPLIATPVEGQRDIFSGNKLGFGKLVRKQLAFEEAVLPNKKIAPCTPAGARPASVGVIDIDDSDGEPESTVHYLPSQESPKNQSHAVSVSCTLEGTMHTNGNYSRNFLQKEISESCDEKDIDDPEASSPFVCTPKRKRASNIVTSDSESDNDDNIPICKLITEHPQQSNVDSHLKSYAGEEKVEKTVTRRRLVKLSKCELKDDQEKSSPNPVTLKTSENEDFEDEEMEDNGLESEGDSLGWFIVGSSSESESADEAEVDDDSVSAGAAVESGDSSEGDMNIGEIMSAIRRKINQNAKWEFEAEMLASFGKDPEMCMNAVCALYRQQTADEKNCKGTIHLNQRGFSQCDASRGTKLAEFLMNGDPTGNLVKSVEELQAYNHKGVELCRTLATHYSKQLFEIYKNKEDPFFLPS